MTDTSFCVYRHLRIEVSSVNQIVKDGYFLLRVACIKINAFLQIHSGWGRNRRIPLTTTAKKDSYQFGITYTAPLT